MHFHSCNIKRIIFFCVAIYFVQIKSTAQTVYQLPPNQPEQDACNALQLCGNSFSTPYSYTGTGKNLDLDKTPCFNQSGGGEKNSVWLQVHTASAGNIVFTIKPVSAADDYDFAVLNITGKSCSALTPDEVVRCNYNSNIAGSNVNGVIGLSDTSRTPYIQEGAVGGSFAQAVFAKSDEVYLIMINNYGNYVSGGPSKGFTIDFTGSTAVFYNTDRPQLSNADVPCNNANSIVLKTSTHVLCNSIAADGSDFTINAPVKIISASGVNCTDRGGYTNSIVINFSSALPPGNYTISAKRGSDNNTLMGFCNDEISLPSSVQFIVKQNGKEAIDDKFICYQQLPYLWNGMQVKNGGNNVATYTIKSAYGCDSTTILNLHVAQAPQQMSASATICDGDSYTLPWDSVVNAAGTYVHHFINSNGCDSIVESITVKVIIPLGGNVEARDSTIQTGFCQNGSVLLRPQHDFTNYLWNNGETSSSIIVTVAGSYSLIAKDQQGCITIDTFVVARYQYPNAAFKSVEKLCEGSSIILDGDTSSTYYLWNNGDTSRKITTSKPGKYWVMLTTAHNCTAIDTVNVVTVQKPSHFLGPDVTKCGYKTITLSPLNNFAAYAWNDGSSTKSIDVSTGGLYWLEATDDNGCIGRDSITVIDSTCYQYFFMPSAFTPNNDFRNDIFKPAFAGPLSGYHLSIYNRWGKLIFSSSNPSYGWDGTVDAYPQPMGVYIWICNYDLNGKPYTEKGTVTLIR